MSERILSCPFCGSTELSFCRTNKYACWIACNSCGGESNSTEKREDAIQIWNTRFPEQEAKIVDDDEVEQ
jgi:Lar family restriction alleviation protein